MPFSRVSRHHHHTSHFLSIFSTHNAATQRNTIFQLVIAAMHARARRLIWDSDDERLHFATEVSFSAHFFILYCTIQNALLRFTPRHGSWSAGRSKTLAAYALPVLKQIKMPICRSVLKNFFWVSATLILHLFLWCAGVATYASI